MKPFDLEAAKNGALVVTRDGTEARIICFDRLHEFPLVALVKEDHAYEPVYAFTKMGKYYSSGNEHRLDLFMAPVKHEGWMSVYRLANGVMKGGRIYKTKEEAIKNADEEVLLETICIEWKE